MRKHLPWYQDLQILSYVGGGIVAIGAIGTGIIVVSRYLTLPERVEGAEKKNLQQDEAINKLTGIEEFWKNVYQQQQQSPKGPTPPPTLHQDMEHPVSEQDARGVWWCCSTTREDCWQRDTWKHCE